MIIENIKATRSHRKFSNKKATEEEILKMLEGARFSSSAKNNQGLRFSYTTDDEKCEKLSKAVMLGGLLKKEVKPTAEERPRGFFLISVKKDTKMPDSRVYLDLGIATQNICLVAQELGYGTCIILSYNKKAFEEIMELPEEYDSRAVIVFGEPVDEVKLVDTISDDQTNYYVENGIHHVPKLPLSSLIINNKK